MAITAVQHQISSAVTVAPALSFSSSDYIAICAGIIAICALFATLYQAYLSRVHNRLSVKPHLVATKVFFIGQPASISINNHGLGPAIITNLSLCYEDKVYQLNNDDSFKSFLDIFNVEAEMFIYDNDTAIGAGCEYLLLKHKEPLTFEMHQSLARSWDKVKVKGKYKSIYDIEYNLE